MERVELGVGRPAYVDNGSWFTGISNPGYQHYTPTAALGNGFYAYDIQVADDDEVYNDLCGSDYDSCPDFWVVESPYAETLSTPTNGTGSGSTVPNTQGWSLVANTASDPEGDPADAFDYKFMLGTTAGCGGVILDQTIGSNTYPLPATWTYDGTTEQLEPGQTYYWHVLAGAYFGDGQFSPCWSFTVAPATNHGTDSAWPMWSSGPMAVNEGTGNLVLSAPGPSYPTAAGALEADITYNSQSTVSEGLGSGWSIGPAGVTELINENLTSTDVDEVEALYSDGSNTFYKATGTPWTLGQNVTFLPTDASTSVLTENPNGSYTLVDSDGSVYSFNEANSSGDTYPTNVQDYSSTAGTGELVYAYNGSNQLTSITAKDGSTTISDATLTLDVGLLWGAAVYHWP